MRTWKQLAVIITFSIWSMASFAIPTTSPVGSVTILGQSYNVEILYDSLAEYDDQSFDDLNPTLTFTTQAAASAAIDALLATFPGFIWNPPQLVYAKGTRVIYSVGPTSYSYLTIHGDDDSKYGPFDLDPNGANTYSFAQFTPTDAVPEPATTLLFGVALAGFFASRRRLRQ